MLHGLGHERAERPLLSHALLIANAAATLAMVGLIWFVQVVHYPLLARLDAAGATEHQRLTGYVVAVPMAVEAATSVALLVERPAEVSLFVAAIGVSLVAVIWLSTALLQVPCHRRLARAPDARTVRRLVAGNWVRTLAWSARGGLVVGMLAASG